MGHNSKLIGFIHTISDRNADAESCAVFTRSDKQII